MSRTVIMPPKMSYSRFSPSEGVLELFYGPRRVFFALVKFSDVEELYQTKGEEARTYLQARFKELVKSR